MIQQAKPRWGAKKAQDGVPILSPEALFARILEPKPAAPEASVRFVAAEGHYVIVVGRPVARYGSKADAERLARNW